MSFFDYLVKFLAFFRANPRKVYFNTVVKSDSAQISDTTESVCGYTFINKSGTFAGLVLTGQDIVTVNGLPLAYNDSVTFPCNENELIAQQSIQVTFQTRANNPALWIITKHYN